VGVIACVLPILAIWVALALAVCLGWDAGEGLALSTTELRAPTRS
jgi:hypothetical protein